MTASYTEPQTFAKLGDTSVGTPTDGQVPVYQSSTGKLVLASPATTGKEIAYVENVTATVTSFAGSAGAAVTVDIPSVSISVPANTGVVWLEAGAYFQQTVLGIGVILVEIIETTSGSVAVGFDARPLPNQNNAFARAIGYARSKVRLGAVASTRTFKLTGILNSLAANTPTVQALNSSASPSYLKAWAE